MAQVINIDLTADLDGGDVVISGSKARVGLPRGSGQHIFKFSLTDNTGLNVHFSGFGAKPGQACPKSAVGDQTGQISSYPFTPLTAEFTDKNTDELTFSYTWFFSCDVPSQKPKFDPIVDNGGR